MLNVVYREFHVSAWRTNRKEGVMLNVGNYDCKF